jgi:hypothetical protein
VPNYPLSCTIPCTQNILLFSLTKWRYKTTKNIEYIKCEVCKENRNEYTYCCSRCNFNLHIRCASLPPTMEVEVHDHPLTAIWKSITFTCDLCGKEGKGMPYLCAPCGFLIHRRCAFYTDAESKLYVTTTLSTSPILLLKLINLTPDFVNYVFKKWIHTMAFTIAPDVILLPTSIVLWTRETWRT